MYRVRLHGRGGQGIKLGGRVLGSAFFAAGYEAQDAARYGAERRGAPIAAYVRADRAPIHERGPIREPDLVVVADASLVSVATAGVLEGIGPATLLLVHGDESADAWRERLRLPGPILTLAPSAAPGAPPPGSACAGAAARLMGVVPRPALEAALRDELAGLETSAGVASAAAALAAFDALAPHAGLVVEGRTPPLSALPTPDWIDLPLDPPALAAPDVFAPATSVEVRTGLWRTTRPVLDPEHCHRCSWICSSHCPDGAISRGDDGRPHFDYDHCKGCLVCIAVCPSHAILAVPERGADATPPRAPDTGAEVQR